MEKLNLSEKKFENFEPHKPLIIGDWSATCCNKTFKVKNNGLKLVARGSEDLEKIYFDLEKKTVSIKVKGPVLDDAPRKVDLSDAPEFFEELRKNVEILLTVKGTYESVTPNAERTAFDVSSGFEYYDEETESEVSKKGVRIDWYDGFEMGEWAAYCWDTFFDLAHHSLAVLYADEDEYLEKIIFDTEKKTVSIRAKKPKRSLLDRCKVDLSDAPEFFEELRKEIETILTRIGTFKSVTPNADRTVFEVTSGYTPNAKRKEIEISSEKDDIDSQYLEEYWLATCCGRNFIIKYGFEALLAARGDEGLEKIIFDVEKKAVSVKVKNPRLTEPPKRIVYLSDVPEFFERLHNNIEVVLTEMGTYESVTPNADRTVFEVS